MNETVQLILAIIGCCILWTTTVVGVVAWLESRFRGLDSSFRKALNQHQEEDDDRFQNLGTRLQRLELKVFGFTHSGIDQGPPPPQL